MIRSALCGLLGIGRPLFQGGMAWIADAQLAAAVSEAGGLGIVSAVNGGVDAVREELRKVRKLTAKPFGFNIMLAAPDAADMARLAVEEQVPVVTTGAGSPAPYVDMWKAAGIKVIPVIASVAYALKMQDLGVDALVAEGAESGGHVGDLHTMALVPQVLDAVDIPVLAAGGIFDGRGAAAMLAMGAAGVQLGTRFLLAHECRVHAVYKDRLIKASDIGTLVTGKRFGDAVRSLKTPFSRKFAKMEADPLATAETLRTLGTGSLRKAVFDGDLEGGSFLAGEVSGLARKTESAAEIVRDVMDGAERILREVGSRLVTDNTTHP